MGFLPEEDEVDVMENEFLGFYPSESEYRADSEAWNYSKLKDFVKEPLLVWRKKHLLPEYEFKTTPEMDYGSLVDCMQFEPHLKDQRFGISSAPTPSEGNLKFVNALIGLVEESEDKAFDAEIMFKKAYEIAGIKTPLFENYIANKFIGSDIEVYFSEKLQNIGKTTLGLPEFEAAERVLKMLNNSEATSEIFKHKGEHIECDNDGNVIKHVEGIPQLGLKARIEGHMLRVLLDWTLIDHVKKAISPFDMKTTAMGVEDFKFTFFKMKYYIQQGDYEAVIKEWAKAIYPDYTVEPFRFIVVDSSGYVEPLVYEIHAPEGQSFLHTFNLGERVYKSGIDIIEDIKYHIENDLWTTSRVNKQNKGKVKINL